MSRIRTALVAGVLGVAAWVAAGRANPAAAQDADTAVDRALQRVQVLIDALKAKGGVDPKTLQELEEIAAELRKAKSAPAPEGGSGGGPGGGAAPGSDAALARAKEWFFRGVELKEEDRARAEEVLREFATDYNLAKSHDDEKSRKVIHDAAEKRLARGFPSREANKMKQNLDGIVQFWEGRWGRGR